MSFHAYVFSAKTNGTGVIQVAAEIWALLHFPSEHIRNEIDEASEDFVAVYFRMGVYLGSDMHLLDMNYYYSRAVERAREIFGPDVRFLLFSNDVQEALARYGHIFPEGFFEIWQGHHDDLTLYRMAKCKGIICANSTFSWWAAWLAASHDAWRCIPGRWFSGQNQTLIQEGAEYIPLTAEEDK